MSINSTERNAQVSPLFQLPAELRDQIWRCVLKDHIIRPIHIEPRNNIHDVHGYNNKSIKSKFSKFSKFRRSSEHRFSLLHVSRQVYAETTSLPYTLSTFAFLDYSNMSNWVATISHHALKLVALVRHVRIPYNKYKSPLFSLFQKGFCSLEKIDVQLTYSAVYDNMFPLDKKTMDWATAHKIELNMTSCTLQEMINRWLAGL